MIKISVITAVFNAEDTIADCLKSIKKQTYPNIEHIVVDGESTDGTLDILNDHKDQIDLLISEKDKGLYDALNKGIKAATGDVIGFLHADDLFCVETALGKYAAMFNNDSVESCYSDLYYVKPENTNRIVRHWRSKTFDHNNFLNGWMPPHPTFYVRNEVYKELGGFRLDIGTAADYEIMLRFLYRNGISARYIPEVLLKMRVGGLSNASLKNRLQANLNDRKAWRVNKLKPYPWTLFLKPLSKITQFRVQ